MPILVCISQFVYIACLILILVNFFGKASKHRFSMNEKIFDGSAVSL